MTTRIMSVMASVMTTNLKRATMVGHVCDGVPGARLSGEQPTDTMNAATIVQITTAAVTSLQIIQAFFMSRVKSRCMRRIVDTFDNPRAMYSTIWYANWNYLSVNSLQSIHLVSIVLTLAILEYSYSLKRSKFFASPAEREASKRAN
jgi:hypothetical protein